MAYLKFYNTPTSSGGGGGGATYAWVTQQFTQAANFSAGLILTLTQTPADPDAIILDYNGRVLSGSEYTVSGSSITVNFADMDVLSYDSPPYFQAKYPFTL
jgi:hypothetical protein